MTERAAGNRRWPTARFAGLVGIALLGGCAADDEAAVATVDTGLTGIRYLTAEGSAGEGFAQAVLPAEFDFPADHASHPDYRTEWWYFTGNVFDQADRHFGFELTIFRLALAPPNQQRESTLATTTAWMGNLAITDTRAGRFHATERLSRGAPGLADASFANADDSGLVEVRIEDWSAEFDGDSVFLSAQDEDFSIELSLAGLERIVAQGDAGLDPKGPEPGNASYYFSAPRLAVTGRLSTPDAGSVEVSGTAWMDREWSTSALSPELAGWDWFALQLDDGRDLMFYRLRTRDGSTSRFSGGSIAAATGDSRRLDANEVELIVAREWTSPDTGVRYPVAWLIRIPSEGLVLDVRPRLDQQEIDLSVRYWEGAVSVTGSAADRPIAGVGYLELAGY